MQSLDCTSHQSRRVYGVDHESWDHWITVGKKHSPSSAKKLARKALKMVQKASRNTTVHSKEFPESTYEVND